jgi:hypothetical protein
MNIIFLFLISSYSFACGTALELEKIFSENMGLPTRPHLETYLKSVFAKASLREKYCGEKYDSPACFQKLTKLDAPSFLQIQNGIQHEESSQSDPHEFLVKEFSNSEARSGMGPSDPHRMPLIIEQLNWAETTLNMVGVQCQQFLTAGNPLLKNAPALDAFLRQKPIPVFDFIHAFEAVALALETPKLSAEFFSLCLENVEKSCALKPDMELCELKRTFNAVAWKYSGFTHQLRYFEPIRDDEQPAYQSTKEILMNKLVLRSSASVMELSRRFSVGICFVN